MQPDYKQVAVKCKCGDEFVTGSTKEEMRVEVIPNVILCCTDCSQKLLLEAGGRVENFNKK
ncbi:MAG: 50S ribosomal protein L31 [Anaerotignum sp.]